MSTIIYLPLTNDDIHAKCWSIYALMLIDIFWFRCVYEWLCFIKCFMFMYHALALYVCMFMFMRLDVQTIWHIVASSSPVRGSRTLQRVRSWSGAHSWKKRNFTLEPYHQTSQGEMEALYYGRSYLGTGK